MNRDTITMMPGPCECDRPSTVAEIRRMKMCGWCERPGLDLIDLSGLLIHVRCLATTLGTVGLSRASGVKRARLCCLGPFRMKRLLSLLDALTSERRRDGGGA